MLQKVGRLEGKHRKLRGFQSTIELGIHSPTSRSLKLLSNKKLPWDSAKHHFAQLLDGCPFLRREIARFPHGSEADGRYGEGCLLVLRLVGSWFTLIQTRSGEIWRCTVPTESSALNLPEPEPDRRSY